MGIEEQPSDATNEAGMEARCPHDFIASAAQTMLTDRVQTWDVVSGLDADLRTHHEALPRATPAKVNCDVAHGKRQAILGSLTQVVLCEVVEQALPLLENRDSLVAAGLPGPGFHDPEDPNSAQATIFRSAAGSSRTLLLTTLGWLDGAAGRVLARAENPDDENHPLAAAHQAIHEEYNQALKAYNMDPLPELRRAWWHMDQATAITTTQLLIARAVSFSRSHSTYPTGLELTRSTLQAVDQLSWIVGGQINLALKYLHGVNWIGKFSAFETAELEAAPELFTDTPDLFDTNAAIQWRLKALRRGPVEPSGRGYCPLDVLDDPTPQPGTPQVLEDFIGVVEDRYDLTIPRGKGGSLPGSIVYLTLDNLLAAETIYTAWQAAMQRNALLQPGFMGIDLQG